MKNYILYFFLFTEIFYCIEEKITYISQISYFINNDYITIIYIKPLSNTNNNTEEKIIIFPITKRNNQINIQAEVIGDLNIGGILYVAKGINSMGVINSMRGIRIVNGGLTVIGEIGINLYDAYKIIIGNVINGNNISLLTQPNQIVSIQTGGIILKSKNISIPSTGVNLPLTIDSTGTIKTVYSTKKMKQDINYIEFSTDSLVYLKPCSFNYTKESNLSGAIQWGFIAEDFENTPLSEIIIYDEKGTIINIDDKKIITYLASIIKKLSKKVEVLEKEKNTINHLEERIANLEKRLLS
jgi:hypothetical protein